jgi:transcriptional regulator with XRE-family HTH domain
MANKKIGKKTKELLKSEFAPLQTKVKLTPGRAIRIYREAQGLSQLELAKKSGLKQSTISGLENDRLSLGLDRAKILARALQVHPSTLAFPDWEVADKSAA